MASARPGVRTKIPNLFRQRNGRWTPQPTAGEVDLGIDGQRGRGNALSMAKGMGLKGEPGSNRQLRSLLFVCCLLGSTMAWGGSSFSQLIAWGQQSSSTVSFPPGNSLPHIERCYELGYDGLELDVEVSKDEVAILAHDLYLNGVATDPTLFTFDELQQFSLGNWLGSPVRIPTLESALQTNGHRGSLVILDMRVESWRFGIVSNVVRQLGADDCRLGFSAYDLSSAQIIKAAFPQTRVFYKLYVPPNGLQRSVVDAVAAAGLDGLMMQQPEDGMPIQDFVDSVHCRGLKLVLFVHYGFNTLPELQALVDAGADYILTVHHEMREQLAWPAPILDGPQLSAELDAASKTLTLSWQPRLPYGHRVQTSFDGQVWFDLGVTLDVSEAPARVQCKVPAEAACGFYRLCYVP